MAIWHKLVFILLFCQSCNCNVNNYRYPLRKTNVVKKYYLQKHYKSEGLLQLVDGKRYNEGNVEIYHLGRWGSICDDEFDEREANVICKQLGFSRAIRYTNNSHFGPARRKYWMDNLYCNGKESKLSDCRFDGWGSSDCSPTEAAGVICKDHQDMLKAQASSSIDIYNKENNNRIQNYYPGRMYIRLAGGRVHDEGRVEVRFGNTEWGVICGDGWSLLEANVICRQLGLGFANAAVQTDFFGGNRSSMILSNVQCRGNEATLEHCFSDQPYDVQCPGRRDNVAAVICTPILADLVIDQYEIQKSAHLEDRQLHHLQCAMEENCLASTAYQIQRENSYNWHLQRRRLLRFTARIANTGTADFRPAVPKHLWEFHQCHMHYHSMEVFATFDILDQYGKKVAEGHKASFCLEDNECLPGVRPFYACANYGDQGISVNCSDIYRYNIDCQWVDITELKPGFYTFKVSINPEFKVPEMTFDNNAAVCNMYYTQSSISINNCVIQRP